LCTYRCRPWILTLDAYMEPRAPTSRQNFFPATLT
jgi:hypothetical protein